MQADFDQYLASIEATTDPVKDADEEKTAKIAKAFIKSVTSEVQQDIPIWEHKLYRPNPALAPSEKPITEFRRWFSQFYA